MPGSRLTSIASWRRLFRLDRPGRAGRLCHRVFRPGAVIGESHQLDPQAIRQVAAPNVRAGLARAAGRDHYPIALGPAADVRPEVTTGAWGSNAPLIRLRSVFQDNSLGVGVEPLGALAAVIRRRS